MDGQTLESQLTFAEHVHELRRRLTWPALILVLGGTVGYIFHNAIITFLKAPLHQTLYYNSPAGGFNFIMKVCMMLGLTLAIPVLVYNLVSFIEPAVEKKITRKLITMVTLLSLILGFAGAAFAYYSVLPMSLHFFGGIKVNGLDPLISADDYLNFALTCIITFIVLFQIPLLILFINHIKPMSPRKMLKYEKYVIIGSLGLALVLPFSYDPITQFIIALPIILLYNLSVLFVWYANREKRRDRKRRILEASAQEVVIPKQLIEAQPLTQPAPAPAPQPVPVAAVTAVESRAQVAQAHAQQRQKPTPIRRTFMDMAITPVRQNPKTLTFKRPMLDVVSRPLPGQNFLDLRSSK